MKNGKVSVPICEKMCLTIEEAAVYSNIGINKLYDMSGKSNCPYVLHIGSRKRLIKRKEFEKYILGQIEV